MNEEAAPIKHRRLENLNFNLSQISQKKHQLFSKRT